MANRKHIAIKFVIWTIFLNFFLQEAHGNEIVPNATELPVHLTSGYLEPGTVDDIQRTTPLGEKTYSLGEVMTLAKQMTIYKIGQKFEYVIVPLTGMLDLVGNVHFVWPGCVPERQQACDLLLLHGCSGGDRYNSYHSQSNILATYGRH